MFRRPFLPRLDRLATGGYGTVAIPILPRPEPYNFGVSIMTVTPTMYTPGAPYSELNWPLMEAQGFSQVRHPPRRPQQKQTDAVHEHHPTPKHPRRGSVVVQPRPRHELLLPDARVDPGVRDGGHAEVGSGSEAWNHRSGGGHEWEGGMDRTR